MSSSKADAFTFVPQTLLSLRQSQGHQLHLVAWDVALKQQLRMLLDTFSKHRLSTILVPGPGSLYTEYFLFPPKSKFTQSVSACV